MAFIKALKTNLELKEYIEFVEDFSLDGVSDENLGEKVFEKVWKKKLENTKERRKGKEIDYTSRSTILCFDIPLFILSLLCVTFAFIDVIQLT